MTPTTKHLRARRRPHDTLARLRRIRRPGHRPGWRHAAFLTAAQAAAITRAAARSGLDPVEYVVGLPQIRVQHSSDVPVEAISLFDHRTRQWAIHVRSRDALETQRFAILREFKHILDQPLIHQLYSPDAVVGHQQARHAAEDFATRVLLPARELRTAIHHGSANPAELAQHFGVAPERLTERLIDLNLALPSPSAPGGHRHA